MSLQYTLEYFHMKAACEASLKALGVEKIDLYQIHAPDPEVPWVETVGAVAQLKEQGKKFRVGSFPFKASGRARASMDTDGFVKVLCDETTDEILGVHMIGPRAADMIAEAVVALEYRASAEDIGIISHPHPTFTETLKEAALAATGNRAIHF